MTKYICFIGLFFVSACLLPFDENDKQGDEKENPPVISQIIGNGSSDDVFKNALIVSGENFDSVYLVTLTDETGTEFEVDFELQEESHLIIKLTPEIEPGNYKLWLKNENGEIEEEVTILRGLSCWDINNNGLEDPEEDFNGDGIIDAADCHGLNGKDGNSLVFQGVAPLGDIKKAVCDENSLLYYYGTMNLFPMEYWYCDGTDWVRGWKDGAEGKEGMQGEKGEEGDVGQQGPQGLPGKDGSDGMPGEKGDLGRSLEFQGSDTLSELVTKSCDADSFLHYWRITDLEPNEYWYCNGQNWIFGWSDGFTGDNGFSSLIMIYDEPIGANCFYGGELIEIGLDNGDGNGQENDGIMQAGEVDSSNYICNLASGDNQEVWIGYETIYFRFNLTPNEETISGNSWRYICKRTKKNNRGSCY